MYGTVLAIPTDGSVHTSRRGSDHRYRESAQSCRMTIEETYRIFGSRVVSQQWVANQKEQKLNDYN